MHRCVAYRKKFKKENIMNIEQISNTCMYLGEYMNILHTKNVYICHKGTHIFRLLVCVYMHLCIYTMFIVCVQVGAMDG